MPIARDLEEWQGVSLLNEFIRRGQAAQLAVDQRLQKPAPEDPNTECSRRVYAALILVHRAMELAEHLPGQGNTHHELVDAETILNQALMRLIESRPDPVAFEYDYPPA